MGNSQAIPALDRWNLYRADPIKDGCIYYSREVELLSGGFLNYFSADEGKQILKKYASPPGNKIDLCEDTAPHCSISYFNGFGYQGAPQFSALDPLRKDQIMATIRDRSKANGKYTLLDAYWEARQADPRIPPHGKADFIAAQKRNNIKRKSLPNARSIAYIEITFPGSNLPAVALTPDLEVILSMEKLYYVRNDLKILLNRAGVEVTTHPGDLAKKGYPKERPRKIYTWRSLHLSRFQAYLRAQTQAFVQDQQDQGALKRGQGERVRLAWAFDSKGLVPLRLIPGGRTGGDFTLKLYHPNSGHIRNLEMKSSRQSLPPAFEDYLKALGIKEKDILVSPKRKKSPAKKSRPRS